MATTNESLFFDGKTYFDALVASLDSARFSVDFETYIFEADRTGTRVLEALGRAAQRGVKVRLLIDGFGSMLSAQTISKRLSGTGVEVRVYRPFNWGTAVLSKKIRHLSRRNHRKTCVIDGKTAWVGSFNVSDVHCGNAGTGTPWRDSAIQIQNSDLSELHAAFESAWNPQASTTHARHTFKHFLINSNATARLRRNRELRRRIRRARRRIFVATPYFSPDHHTLKALRHASLRGVDVRVLLPEYPDVPGMSWINSVFYRSLFRSKIRVYLYGHAVFHAKTTLIDDWAILGSSNLNHRSLLHDLEADAIVTSSDSLKALEAQFQRDLAASKEIALDNSSAESPLTLALDQLAMWIRDWT